MIGKMIGIYTRENRGREKPLDNNPTSNKDGGRKRGGGKEGRMKRKINKKPDPRPKKARNTIQVKARK